MGPLKLKNIIARLKNYQHKVLLFLLVKSLFVKNTFSENTFGETQMDPIYQDKNLVIWRVINNSYTLKEVINSDIILCKNNNRPIFAEAFSPNSLSKVRGNAITTTGAASNSDGDGRRFFSGNSTANPNTNFLPQNQIVHGLNALDSKTPKNKTKSEKKQKESCIVTVETQPNGELLVKFPHQGAD